MRALLLTFALLFCPPLLLAGDMVATHETSGDTVRLTQKPCGESVLRHLPQGTRGYYRAALAVIGGQQWSACWAMRQDGMVHLVYTDGDQGMIPVAQFRQEPDA
jgi:hypothetical protein